MTSWMTFSCMSEKGPPLPVKPILLAGTCREYSKKAIAHENTMTPMSGQLLEMFICCNFKWPYHAKVMKMFDPIRSNIV